MEPSVNLSRPLTRSCTLTAPLLSRLRIARFPVMLYALSIAVAARAAGGSGELIEPILRKHHLPGMAWVVASADSILETGALGVRKLKSAELITPADRFHLGSNTKAMTATVIAMGVEEGKLSWKSRPLDVFPDLESTIDP